MGRRSSPAAAFGMTWTYFVSVAKGGKWQGSIAALGGTGSASASAGKWQSQRHFTLAEPVPPSLSELPGTGCANFETLHQARRLHEFHEAANLSRTERAGDAPRYGVLGLVCALSMITYLDRLSIGSASGQILESLHLKSPSDLKWVFFAFVAGLRPVRGSQRLAGRRLRPPGDADPHRALVVGLHDPDRHGGNDPGRLRARRRRTAGRGAVPFRRRARRASTPISPGPCTTGFPCGNGEPPRERSGCPAG